MSISVAEWCYSEPDFECCFSAFLYDKNWWSNGRIHDPDLPAENITESYFWTQICSNFMRDTFAINIDFVSE